MFEIPGIVPTGSELIDFYIRNPTDEADRQPLLDTLIEHPIMLLRCMNMTLGNADIEPESEVEVNIVQRLIDDPVFFVKAVLNFYPFKYQVELLTTQSKKVCACWGRQTGKTTIIALKAIHFAFTKPGVLVLVVSPGIRQSMIMFNRISTFIFDTPVLNACVSNDTKTEIKLNNKSRILALPCSQDGSTLRGYTADLVIMDEAAFMPETVISNVLFPMLATTETTRGTGICIMISTPWGRNHIFYRSTLNKKYFYSHVKSIASPIIKKSFLEDQEKEIGQLRFRIEYEAEFVEDATQLFTSSLIRGMLEYDFYANRVRRGQPELLTDSEVLMRKRPYKGDYILGLDVGKRRDYTVLTIWRRGTRRVAYDPDDEIPHDAINFGVPTKTIKNAWILVYLKRFEIKSSYTKVVEPHVKDVYKQFNIIGGYIDRSGVGEHVVEALLPECPMLSGIILTLSAKHQLMMWYFSMCERLQVGIPDDRLIITEHLEQNFGYTSQSQRKKLEDVLKEEGTMRFWHPEGRNDDILWSCVLALYATAGEIGEWSVA